MVEHSKKVFERRYHCTWMASHGPSPLTQLREWLSKNPGQLAAAPRLLLVEAAIDVVTRMPKVAAREPTRRHRKHFSWLLGWHVTLLDAIERTP